jgi:hypothetical protein
MRKPISSINNEFLWVAVSLDLLHTDSFLRTSVLLDPLFNLAFEPSGCCFSNPIALRESTFPHHLPDGRSPKRDAFPKFLESEVSHVFSPYLSV